MNAGRWMIGVAMAGALLGAAPASAAVGDLLQKAGTAGCISETGTGGTCVDGAGLDGTQPVIVSPDGRSAYAVALFSESVVVFDRNPSTGALTQKPGTAGCVSETGTGGSCADGQALDGVSGVAVSPDGRSVYAASKDSDAVVAFDRDTSTGALTQKPGTAGCVSDDGTGGTCTDGVSLNGAVDVQVSPDGRSVYVVSSFIHAVSVFDRDASTGELTQKPGTAGCINDFGALGCAGGTVQDVVAVTVSADGRSLYTAAQTNGLVAVFDRDTATGELTQKSGTDGCISSSGAADGCAQGVAMNGAAAVTVSRDGRSAYVAAPSSDAVAVFDRDTSTGALTQKSGTAGCVSETGTSGACVDGRSLGYPRGVAVSPDGRSVYVAAAVGNAVAAFERDPSSGALTQRPGTAACVSETGTGATCADGNALNQAYSVTVSPDGRSVYAGAFNSDAVAVFDRFAAGADVSVSVNASAQAVNVGDQVTYKLRFANAGPDAASGATVTATLPATLTFVSATSACSREGQVVTCSAARLIASGETFQPSVTVQTTAARTETVTVTASSIATDPVPANNSASASISVGAPTAQSADLRVSLTAPATVATGQQFTYKLRTDNFGPDTATAVSATVTLPDSVSFVSGTGGCTAAGQVVTCNLGKRTNGQSSSQNIVVTANTPDQAIATAGVSATQSDPVPSNNNGSATTTIA